MDKLKALIEDACRHLAEAADVAAHDAARIRDALEQALSALSSSQPVAVPQESETAPVVSDGEPVEQDAAGSEKAAKSTQKAKKH